jgi:hypothetical protein
LDWTNITTLFLVSFNSKENERERERERSGASYKGFNSMAVDGVI